MTKPSRPDLPEDHAIPSGTGSQLDALIQGAEARHPGESGLRLVDHGPEAFAIRARSALLAGRSLDVQTYIWHADVTGAYLAHRLLEAADRGVRVRLLVDDMDARAKNAGFAGLDFHRNIEVRMFNPFFSRRGKLNQLAETVGSFNRINRRMHNKSWIADNRMAIVGGRNLGDEYFGASEEVNFVDLDFAMVGPITRDASASFDRYWNAPATYPIRILDPESVSEEALARVRSRLARLTAEAETSRYADELRGDDAIRRLLAGDWPMQWTADWRFVSDDPNKVSRPIAVRKLSRVTSLLLPAATSARESITLISPYFVPGKEGARMLIDAARGGVRVRVLTNSLVANDVAAVHGGYTRWRKALLEGGVELWELKPLRGGQVRASLLGRAGASLHTKALAVDGKSLFVGSYNVDPRSAWLNCEQGVFAESGELTGRLEAMFDRQCDGSRAWKVHIRRGRLRWTDGADIFHEDPHASFSRRFQAWITRVVGLDAQL